MTQCQPQKAWILRISPQKYTDVCLDRDMVAVGWSAAERLSKIHDWESFKKHIRETHPGDYESNRALGNAAGSVWRFIHEIERGDLVVVPGSNGFYVAEVKSDVQWSESDANEDFSWQRRVIWLNRVPLSRAKADNYLRRRMKARQTCVDASDLITEIKEARDREGALSLVNEIRKAALGSVMEKIDHVVDNKGLEYLVCALVQASGVHAEVLPNRQEKEGDIDVLANLKVPAPENVVGGTAEIRIGYQVKHHDGQTGIDGLEQIRKAVEGGKVDYGFLVTSAKEFSEEVAQRILHKLGPEYQEKLDAPSDEDHEVYRRVGLIDRKSLAEWLLNVGLENGDLEKIRF